MNNLYRGCDLKLISMDNYFESGTKFWVLGRFSEVHEFEKPNDEIALNLMNSCATAVLEEYPDVVFAYGFSDEYRYTKYYLVLLCII